MLNLKLSIIERLIRQLGMCECDMSTTITVSRETKRLLDLLRKGRTWDEFLRELALEYRKVRVKRVLDELRKTAKERDFSFSETRLKLRLE